MVLANLTLVPHMPLVPNSAPDITLIPTSGILDLIFHQTWIAFNLLGWPGGDGIRLNLIQLVLLVILALAALAVTERLTGGKPGGMLLGVIITVFGTWLIVHFVTLPGNLGLAIEGVPIIAALIGGVIVAVFYVLIKKSISSGK